MDVSMKKKMKQERLIRFVGAGNTITVKQKMFHSTYTSREREKEKEK